MPYYIKEVPKNSNHYGYEYTKDWIGQEIKLGPATDLIGSWFVEIRWAVRKEITGFCRNLVIEWHDYPSEECRKGEL